MIEPTAPGPSNSRPGAGSVVIREMELDDLPGVFKLGERLFTAEKWPTLHRTWEEPELLDLYSADPELCLVAESRSILVGFALGSVIEKPHSSWKYGYLVWIGIEPEFKSRGLGGRLVSRMTEIFIGRGARMMLVDTEADNKEALGFFHKQGFNQEVKHIYLSRNLMSHPLYLKRKAERERLKAQKIKNGGETDGGTFSS